MDKRKLLTLWVCLFMCLPSVLAARWQCNVHDYRYDMTMFVGLRLSGSMAVPSENCEIAAFCGDECRGVATVETIEGTTQKYYYLRVRSNVADGETITFKCFDTSLQEEITLAETVTFQSQAMSGYPSQPVVLTGELPIIKGDTNGDGKVSVTDFAMITNDILGLQNVGFVSKAADLNGDGKITVVDATMCVNIILGI